MINEVSRKEELFKISKDELVDLAFLLENNQEIYLQALKDLRNKKYKSTSETSDVLQLSIFNELEDVLDNTDINKLNEEEIITYKRSKNKKTRNDYSNLEVKEIHHELDDLNCPNCLNTLVELKPDISEKLIYKKAECYIERHIIHNYVCRKCSDDTNSLVSFKSSDEIIKPIKGSIISSSMISAIAYDKFVLATPLYRQEADYKRQGINISRQNMSNWLSIVSNDYLEFVYDKMHEDILKLKCYYSHYPTPNSLISKSCQ